jgi:hypothetical protein
MKKAPCLPIAFAAVLFSAGCLDMNVPPAGSYSDVLVVSEDGATDPLARVMTSCLTQTIDYYTDEEQAFNVSHMRAVDLVGAPEVKSIVVCGVANPVSSVGQYILSRVGSEGVQKIDEGEASVFKRENVPSAGQLTLIVTAGNEDVLHELIVSRGDQIVETIEASCRSRLREFLLRQEDKALVRKLRESYGFVVRVPTDYRMINEDAEPAGVELLREGPARLLGVFWIDWDHEPSLEDSRELFQARADYVWQRYDGDVMDSTRVDFEPSRLGGYSALRMSGYWSNSRALAGGCYETYFIYYEGANLLWCVDLLAFAPGLPKHPQFRELLALAETFKYD